LRHVVEPQLKSSSANVSLRESAAACLCDIALATSALLNRAEATVMPPVLNVRSSAIAVQPGDYFFGLQVAFQTHLTSWHGISCRIVKGHRFRFWQCSGRDDVDHSTILQTEYRSVKCRFTDCANGLCQKATLCKIRKTPG